MPNLWQPALGLGCVHYMQQPFIPRIICTKQQFPKKNLNHKILPKLVTQVLRPWNFMPEFDHGQITFILIERCNKPIIKHHLEILILTYHEFDLIYITTITCCLIESIKNNSDIIVGIRMHSRNRFKFFFKHVPTIINM